MKKYDVLIAGGGIAGSIAAKFAAKRGLSTLFVEKMKTPRDKACSGIQFPYFEKIIGETIPSERLCNHQLNQTVMYYPNGKSSTGPFAMINFMRKPFDDYLNEVAISYGAEFRDQCAVSDFTESDDRVEVTLKSKDGPAEQVSADYLVDATGLRPFIRKKLRPGDFGGDSAGATMNYYVDGTADMNPNALYQFWNLDWNDTMFAWVYTKTLDDGKDYWVVGTGCTYGRVLSRQDAFYRHIQDTFKLKGEIVNKEGYASPFNLTSDEKVWLGEGRLLMTGDAAGLVDPVRGVGMDAAALSGRLVAEAIYRSGKFKADALDIYRRKMRTLVRQTTNHQKREITGFSTNEQLQEHLESSSAKIGTQLAIQMSLNKIRSAERQWVIPP